MKPIDEELLLEKLIEDIKFCKDVNSAKELLFSLCKPSPILEKAVTFCITQHEGQKRKSGEPYAVHPMLVACLVAFLSSNEDMIAASLLHDVVEDTHCEEKDLIREFGAGISRLVNGLTKIVEIREDNLISSKSNQNLTKSALTFRNMLLASIEDVGVLVVKLCDRLHNMLTLDALRDDKKRRISEETLVVYAPIAHRLGISSIKNYLEDLSFKYLMPDEFTQINNYINSNDQYMQLGLNDFISKIELLFLKNGFRQGSFEIHKRIKHNYSVYLKMQRKGISIEEVLDLLGVRIMVETVSDCYLALGILHTNFNPLISRFKDYIALPKQNGYQTIHTTLFDAKNIIEAQIRTFDMHKIAEFGVAAHWKYKEGGNAVSTPKLDWLADISMQSNIEGTEDYSAVELYEYAKDSLYIEDIAVYSPKGEIFTLPRGATVLDFAYEVHTKIGLHAKSAYVNRVKVPLLTELKNGDIVRIVTASERFYRCSWIDSVKTGKARASIRAFCKQKLREIHLQTSLNILSSVFSVKNDKILKWIEKENLSKKIRQVPNDSVYFKDVVNTLKKYAKKSYWFDKYELKEQKIGNIIVYSNHKIANVEFDYCCHPKRGDAIMGFIESGNVVVHHKLCDKADKLLEKQKDMVFIKWDANVPKSYKVIFSLENKKGTLADFLTTLSKMQINILTINLSREPNSVVDYFEINIEIPDDIVVENVKDRLKTRYKILDFTSLNDAYKTN
ncbi:bifunctional (p)ppGpp synthetase/guanosine-3',5'-bis(diphosphate) 3'-pyrophosphohydrolase [Campylobacter sp. US33a]|uniref:Bifunctional (P)ppGpp synthetase/guanosine-3',5'-bis(Diphosphate) 3'-pyrophosphohydrolase n=1 Tax=Campylobacter sp. CCS1377 TaxID=3158229 RepID=A0AAU7E4G6_9BACT|nr:bifunctional (p)ppGpp synthetase/guanosine-3',5'-bis(diphosphate) 3'-pyrophosphohydrolase [Campylobacter sp. US33a]TEY03590.1 bifunctional (p)ppGpp synthetase/guanosine-3',5'-bis(diphosphate) 3'-pyrophosphohydrolase [Campylobacter sp. US33a]